MTADAMAARNGFSMLRRWDPRLRIIALLLLAFSCSAVTDLRAVPALVALPLLFWAISGVPPRQLLRRLRYPSLLIGLLVVILPFAGGRTTVFEIGFLSISKEGLVAALLIAARFYAILILAILFLGCAPLLLNIRALQALGLPYIMADMALLMVRYLEVLGQDLQRMRRSMQLRGHQEKRCSWQALRIRAWLAGSLLLRSYERADGVYKAMRLRGYGQMQRRPAQFSATLADGLALAAAAAVAVGVFLLG